MRRSSVPSWLRAGSVFPLPAGVALGRGFHSFALRGLPSLLLATVLLAAACGSDGVSTTPTQTGAATTASVDPTTSAAPATTGEPPSSTVAATTAAPTTAAPIVHGFQSGFVVAGPAGVFSLDRDGRPVRVLTAPAAIAVDDTMGGLVYQLASGRTWNDADSDTTVWWIPAGSSIPRQLLVPSAGHTLTVHDVTDVGGRPTVLYTRHEGHTPDDAVDTLRTYDIDTRVVREVSRLGAWESGFGPASMTADMIAVKWYGHLVGSCMMMTVTGTEIEAAPFPEYSTCEEADCPQACELSPDGRLAYATGVYESDRGWHNSLVIRDALDGEILTRPVLAAPMEMPVTSLDLSGTTLVVNAPTHEEDAPAWVLDLDRAGDAPAVLAVGGVARVVRAPLTVRPLSLALRPDGLGPFDFGTSVDAVMTALTHWLGPPDHEEIQVAADVDLTVRWDDPALYLEFTYGDYFDHPALAGDTPVFHYYVASSSALRTATGVGVGSTVDELRGAYPAARFGSPTVDCSYGWWFATDAEALAPWRLGGRLDRAPTEAEALVIDMWAGFERNPC